MNTIIAAHSHIKGATPNDSDRTSLDMFFKHPTECTPCTKPSEIPTDLDTLGGTFPPDLDTLGGTFPRCSTPRLTDPEMNCSISSVDSSSDPLQSESTYVGCSEYSQDSEMSVDLVLENELSFFNDTDTSSSSENNVTPLSYSPASTDSEMEYSLSTTENFSSTTAQDVRLHLEDGTSPPCQHVQSPLPFPLLSQSWYLYQQRLDKANLSRTMSRATAATEVSDDQAVIAVYKSQVPGTIVENLEVLKRKCTVQMSELHLKHLRAIVSVATFIQTNGPVIATQDVAEVYCTQKQLKGVTSH